MISAKEANHKFAVETKLLTDKETINYIVKRNKTFGEKIVNGINRMIQRKIGSKEQKFLAGIRTKWEAALEESRKEGDKKGATGDGKVAYAVGKESVDEKNFVSEIDAWNREGRPDSDVFILGSTGDVLQGLGAIENDIYMNASKINNIFKTHPEMTLDEIKKIPQILNDPILILKSRNVGRNGKYNSRIVIFGSVKVKNGKPVLSVLDLRPVEKRLVITDMQKVTSAYTKDNNPVSFVKKSDVLYIDKNKKRAASLLSSIGFQMPIEVQRVGSIGSISYKRNSVNSSGVPFTDIVKTDGKKFAFGKERDREYIAAVERGDMKTALEESRKEVENKYGKYHMILTVFPSNMDYLNKQINKSTKTLYDKKKESADVPDTRRRNSTGSLDITDSNKSISGFAEKDNRKFSIGKERDREYLAAVERGDMETALEESRKEGDKKDLPKRGRCNIR